MTNYKIYLAGKFATTNQTLEVTNPFENCVFAVTYMANEQELETAIIEAQLVEVQMKQLSSYKKCEILQQIAEGIKQNADTMAHVLAQEAGKPLKHAKAEVMRAVQTFVVASEECKRMPAEIMSLDWTPEAKNKEGVVKYFPVGIVAGISPFNFPLNLAVHKIAPAIACGCPIILKPASNTPLSTLLLAQIIDKTDLPKGAVSILPMNRQTGNKLVTDDRIKLLTFTGSPDVGWQMKKDAGKKKVVLELGGNAGVIICETADVKHAAQRCLMGGFAYAGQICIHVQRIFVHESLYNEFIEHYVPLVKALNIGNTLESDTDFSVMIDQKNAMRVETWIHEAANGGARILCGGVREGNLVFPTVLTDVHKDMKVCAEEVFGPVVTISKFNDFKEAIDLLNYGKFGLQAGVFTNAIDEMDAAFNHIHTGGVIINDVPTFRVDHMPYGGIKDSGLGREGVKYAMHDMLEAKILVKNIL